MVGEEGGEWRFTAVVTCSILYDYGCSVCLHLEHGNMMNNCSCFAFETTSKYMSLFYVTEPPLACQPGDNCYAAPFGFEPGTICLPGR